MSIKEKEMLRADIIKATEEICEIGKLQRGQILVVGCSTSEVCGAKIGTDSVPEVGTLLVDAILSVLSPRGIFLAAQCCEHLNRAIVIEGAALPFAEPVNVTPAPKAGGSFATAAYAAFKEPIVVEEIKADAGLDIGNTLYCGYPEDWVRILGNRIKKVHFKDYRMAAGGLHGFVDLLAGDVDYPEVVKALNEIGYKDWVSAEMIPNYKHYTDAIIYNTSNAMDRILGRK